MYGDMHVSRLGTTASDLAAIVGLQTESANSHSLEQDGNADTVV